MCVLSCAKKCVVNKILTHISKMHNPVIVFINEFHCYGMDFHGL